MEPRFSMSAYAVVMLVTLAALSARGFPQTAAGLALGLGVAGAVLDGSYLVRRQGDRVLAPRRALDRVVRLQWLGIALVGAGMSELLELVDASPWDHASPVVQTFVIGFAIALPSIYVSSLIDWYWILPKVSGMTGSPPCVRVGGETFAGVTKIWFFHRAAATAIVTAVLAGVPGYLAGNAGDGAEGAVWVIIGSTLAIGYNSVNNGLTRAFRYAFNPDLFVGDIVRVRANPEDRELQDAYAVDVSIHGLKYRLLPELRRPARFLGKGDQLSLEAMATTYRASDPQAPCPSAVECRAANWYCFRNRNANALNGADATAPLPWTPRASRDDVGDTAAHRVGPPAEA